MTFRKCGFREGLRRESRLQRMGERESRKWKQLEGISFQEGCWATKKGSLR